METLWQGGRARSHDRTTQLRSSLTKSRLTNPAGHHADYRSSTIMSASQEPGTSVEGLAFAYKIVAEPVPNPLPHALPLSALDAQDGFIHLSSAAATPGTADAFFAAAPALWLLKLDIRALSLHPDGGEFRWAPGPAQGFVHLYARAPGAFARLGMDTVAGVRACTKAPGAR
jgi:uncharacterized protein (DUF952 family)